MLFVYNRYVDTVQYIISLYQYSPTVSGAAMALAAVASMLW